MSGELTVRYVAGLGFGAGGDTAASYSVWALAEQDGRRIGQPSEVINPMTKDQATHLHMQLGRALGKDYDATVQALITELSRDYDYTIVQDSPAGRALWKANRADVALKILRDL